MRIAAIALVLLGCASSRATFDEHPTRDTVARAFPLAAKLNGASGSLRVELPTFADEETRVMRGEVGLSLRPRVHHASWRIDRGVAVADEIAHHVDAAWDADDERTELHYVLRDRSAPARFDFTVAALGRAELEVELEGTIGVVASGRTLLRIPRPFAIDARGTRRNAGMRLEGDDLIVELDTSDLAYPIVLDPGVETATWTKIGGHDYLPRAAKIRAAENAGKLLAFDVISAETWEYDGIKWSKKLTATSPGDRGHSYMAVVGGKTFLFDNGDGIPNVETWQWDGANWSKLSTPIAPPTRYNPGWASLGSSLVMFGGTVIPTGASDLGDTWTFNGTTWSQYMGSGPPARSPFIVGRVTGGALFAGGTHAGAPNYLDTWLWTGSSWVPQGSLPTTTDFYPGEGYTDGTKAYARAYLTAPPNDYVFSGGSWAFSTSALSGAVPRMPLSDGGPTSFPPVWDGTSAKWALAWGRGEGLATLAKISGGVWTAMPVDNAVPEGCPASQASALSITTFTAFNRGRTWTRSAGAWTSTAPSGGSGVTSAVHGFVTESGGKLYAALCGSPNVVRLDATGWTAVSATGSRPSCPSSGIEAGDQFAASSTGDLFFVDGRLSGGAWSSTSNTSPKATFKGDVYSLASDGTLGKWNGVSFSPAATSGKPTATERIAALGNRLVAIGKSGSTYDAVSIWDGTAWRSRTITGGPPKVTSFFAAGSTFYAYERNGGGSTLWTLDLGFDLGTACTANTDCTSLHCTDGVCCDVASCGAGSSCSTVTIKGSCRKNDGTACSAAGECGSGVCASGTCCATACEAATSTCAGPTKPGTCLLKNGQTSASGAACASGIVSDGLCCDAACGGKCASCKSVDTGIADGTCAPILAGKDPASECPDPADPNSCGPDGFCDGKGACRIFAPDGKVCSDVRERRGRRQHLQRLRRVRGREEGLRPLRVRDRR